MEDYKSRHSGIEVDEAIERTLDNSDAITAEETRAKSTESQLNQRLSAEVARATSSEAGIGQSLGKLSDKVTVVTSDVTELKTFQQSATRSLDEQANAIENNYDSIRDLKSRLDSINTGKFYGYYTTTNALPHSSAVTGYAYVGTATPYKIYNYDGSSWSYSGTNIEVAPSADNITIGQNSSGKLEVKNGAITLAKLDDQVKAELSRTEIDSVTHDEDKVTFDDKDGNVLYTIDAATVTHAGVMTKTDKEDLNQTKSDIVSLNASLDEIADAIDTIYSQAESASASATSASASAAAANEKLADIEATMETLPEAQAVSAQVALNTSNISNITENIAYPYTDSETYGKGDVVMYNGHLYESLVIDNSALPTDTSKWAFKDNFGAIYATQKSLATTNTNVTNLNQEVTELGAEVSEISKEEIYGDNAESISIYDDDDLLLHKIDKDGADFKNLKSNGKDVIVNDNIEISDYEEEQAFTSDDYDENGNGELYAKIGSYGVKTKAIMDLQGNPIGNKKNVDCYGDSLTDEGAWVVRLQQLLGGGYVVRNYGIYGQAPDKITYRQGSVPFLVKEDVTIPSSGSVDIVFNRWQGDTAAFADINTSHAHSNINPVSICGVQGNLSYNSGYKFTRLNSGAAREIKSGSIVRTNGYKNKGDVTVLWMGTNVNIADSSNYNYAINLIKKAAECVVNGKYIVVGLHAPRTDYGYNISIENVKSFNSDLKTEFGYKFVDQLDYMSKYALAELGLTPTSQDTQDMSEGKVPHQIMDSNYLHYNASASALLGDLFYNAILENGFLGNNY